MVEQSSPTEVLAFRAAYGDLWRQYLAGREIAPLATLQRSPFDYWQLVYRADDIDALIEGLRAAMVRDPRLAARLLRELADLFAVEDHGLDVAPDVAFFSGNFFARVIAPVIEPGDKLKTVLGFVKLNMLLTALISLAHHNVAEQVTPYCFLVAHSAVYHAALRCVGTLMGPPPAPVR